jgi:CHAT domain-containing protein
MKTPVRFLATLFVALLPFATLAQAKYDKILKKADAAYNEGTFDKAASGYAKLKKKSAKLGATNKYLPVYYLRQARQNLATGLLPTFESNLASAISASITAYGENSLGVASTQIDVAELYNEFGNYRKGRELAESVEKQMIANGLLDDALKAKVALIKAEAMTGQGFCKDALALLDEVDEFFLSRAVDREQIAEGDKIVKKRIPEEEFPVRFGSYAKLVTLRALALSKMGEVTRADSAFMGARNWIDKKLRYLGEFSLALVYNNYLHSRMLSDNGLVNFSETEKELGYNNVLNDLRRRAKTTHQLAHAVYQSYLEQLQKDESNRTYDNIKFEYEKMLEKNFTKQSAHNINLKAVEFDAKLNKDKTRNLENAAINVLNAPNLPQHYPTKLRVLEFLTSFFTYKKVYTNTEAYINSICELKKELYGAESPEYHLARLKLAAFYLDYTNKIEEAGKIYQASYNEVVSREIGPWHKDHLDILNHLATLYELNDRYKQAASILDKASDVAYSKYSNEDPDYAEELVKISKLQLKIGAYDRAEKNLTKALTIFEKYRKDESRLEQYVHALETQAKLYGIKGMFDEAQENLDRTVKMISKSDVQFENELATAEELSSLFIQLGKYSQTDAILTKLISEYEKLYGKNTLRLIEPLTNKGKIQLLKGDYTEAERTALRANELAVKTYSETSTKTAQTQKLLSDLYYLLGDYEKAEEQIKKALASQQAQFGRSHIETAKSISQLALIKFHKGDNRKEVEKLMLESRDIMAEKLGKENPQYAEILKNVAAVYISEKRYDIAFSSLTTAENIWRTKAGRKNNINLASIYTLTGDVYYQQKNYKKAEEFYIKAKDLYEKFFSRSHPEFVKVQSKLAKVYYMEKDFKRSKKLIEESLDNYEGFIKNYFPALSEREKAKYWNTIKGDFEFYNTLAFSQLDDFKDLTGRVYNYQLITKALLLNSSIKVRERILSSNDEVLKGQYNAWLQKKETLTLALSMSTEQLVENDIDRAVLENQVEALEKELSQRSEGFGQSFENKRITYEEVRKSLNVNEVALEMVRYRHFNHVFTDTVIYAALYIKNEYKTPRAVLFKEGAKMETRFFKFYRNAIIGKVHDSYSYTIFWEPIQTAIGQVSTVFLSADGIYNQINLESIATPDNRYVLDNSNIVLVSNTKDIYLNKVKTKAKTTDKVASMFGNPTFYLASSDNTTIASLPGTEKEVSQLQLLFKQNGWVTNQYVEDRAAEETIKGMNSPKIFHIATHGLYKPGEEVTLEEEMEGNEALLTQNPLMRTGLLLSGAGDLLQKTDYNYNMENGILTAYEAMNLNLDKTDLVVLSACETGLGDLQAGEGVYGLQRAFLVAGAKVLIMSMFKVDDDATQKLFLKFYLKWLNSGDIRQSFTDAKKELRTEYPEPIYWGAFMMIGME